MDLAASQCASAMKTILYHVTLSMDVASVSLDGLGKSARYVRIYSQGLESEERNRGLTSMSDQDRISSYKVNTISTRQVMRVKKNINKRIFSRSKTKFSDLKS